MKWFKKKNVPTIATDGTCDKQILSLEDAIKAADKLLSKPSVQTSGTKITESFSTRQQAKQMRQQMQQVDLASQQADLMQQMQAGNTGHDQFRQQLGQSFGQTVIQALDPREVNAIRKDLQIRIQAVEQGFSQKLKKLEKRLEEQVQYTQSLEWEIEELKERGGEG